MHRISDRPGLPDSFEISFTRTGAGRYVLKTSQEYPVRKKDAFFFFEDPKNLFHITPPWLDFRLESTQPVPEVSEGAEFYYRIRWLGLRLRWKSMIINYHPPEEFTDVQVIGPYARWEHTHRFQETSAGTIMRDEVRYALPLGLIGDLAHSIIVKRQLRNIFSFRAVKIGEWVITR